MVPLLVFIIATSETGFGRKICYTQTVHLAITFSKIQLDIIIYISCRGPLRRHPLKNLVRCFCGRLGDQEILSVMNFDGRKILQRILKDH